ncbi:hypothetical protein K2173_001994 [Erythroxylum novogranatense]|uniref:Synaptotagmin-3-like n=1 Tax=Erythroxylum novogranatense TaxID=1862640 RepID=A0AAV8SQ04_9ROSI|nr:hypothetical protein K2173_001994 [Erythroxylum novogranatense]
MGLQSSLLGIIGFGIGIPIGLLLGFFIFLYSEPQDVKEPVIKAIQELDTCRLFEFFPEIPMWVKHPDYDRIDWLNKYVCFMWPYLDRAISGMIRSMTAPIFEEYSSKFLIKSIDFKSLTLGTLPPIMHGIKVHESNEEELVFETAVRWAGNPNITLVLNFFSVPVTVQLLDVQVSAVLRITFKPLVPTFPCFSNILVSLLEKPHVDFGMKLLGADVMAIPGLYQFVQELIRKQIASLYLWPQTLSIQILDDSAGAVNKPVGILHVKVVRALNLLKMDLFGSSDPYVKVSLSGERFPGKKTSIKMKSLNPQWNEDFKFTVRDPDSQILRLQVYDWEKFGTHDKLGMQVVPLKTLTPHETKAFTLVLAKNENPNDPENKKPRGKLMIELTFKPFREEGERFSGLLDCSDHTQSESRNVSRDLSLNKGGLLVVTVQGAEKVEGKRHNNPYAVIMFRGDLKQTKINKKTRDPIWNEEFQFVLEEAPLKEKINIEVMSKRRGFGFGFRRKETLGHVDINLEDVVHNGRINQKYHLINSRNGLISVDIRWRVI